MSSLAYGALWLFIFSVPWESIIRVENTAIVTRVTGTLAAALALLAVVAAGRFRRWHVFHVAALLFVVWAGCVHMLHASGERLPFKYWTFVQLVLVLWIVWEAAPSRQRQLGLLAAYVLGAYVAAIATIKVYRQGAGDADIQRFSAGQVDPNDLAMTLALALPMAWYLATTYRHPLMQWAARLYLPVGILTLGLTGSRGGMLAGLVGLLIVPLTMTRLTPAKMVMAIVMLAASGALAIAYVPDRVVQRLATTGLEVQDMNMGGRFKLWEAGIYALGERPVAGFGTGGYKKAITGQLGPAAQVAHNSFVSVLVEQGIVGFVLYMTMFGAVYLALRDLPTLERRFTLVLLAALCTAMMPLTWEDRKPVWVILAMLLGLAQAYVAERGGAATGQPHSRRAPVAGYERAARRLGPLAARRRNVDRDATA